MKTETYHYTYAEFINYVENCKPSERAKSGGLYSSKTGTHSFTQTESFSEAIQLARGGWTTGLKELKITDGLLVGNGSEFVSDVVGSFVNVPNYLMGLPDTMFALKERREYNLPLLTIYIPLTYHAGKSSRQAIKYVDAVIKIVNEYQTKNNVRIIGVFDSTQRGVREIVNIKIKDYNERFVINNIAFAFHPSFYRRLWFKFLESKEYIGGAGYGICVDNETTITFLRNSRGDKDKSISLLPFSECYSNDLNPEKIKAGSQEI